MTTDRIAPLPVDPRRKLPIPYMNQRDDGTHDFLSIFAPHVVRCLADHLCGICGEPLSFASAFVGGPLSARSRIYSDPPFHPECAKRSMRLCPHILIGRMKRAPAHRLVSDAKTHESATLEKPQEWVIGIAPTSETEWEVKPDGIYIYAGKLTKTIVYRYDENGNLVYPSNG